MSQARLVRHIAQVTGSLLRYSPNTPHYPTMRPGFCASPPAVANFDLRRFAGTWYVQRQTPSAFQTPDQTCARLSIGAGGGGSGRLSLWSTCTVHNGSIAQGGNSIERGPFLGHFSEVC